MIKGIDVSDNQGVIDWEKVKLAGADFVILRSIRGSGKEDYQFAANVRGCRKSNLGFDIYKYSYADTVEKAGAEADLVIGALQKYAIDCTVWWDMEDKSLKGLGKEKLTLLIQTAGEKIQKAGYHFGIYCNKDWYENVLDTKPFTCPFWIARYVTNAAAVMGVAPDVKYKPAVKHELFGWQYSSQGVVPGIAGNVDMNILYQIEETGGNQPTVQPKKNPNSVPVYSLFRGRLLQKPEYTKWLQWELTEAGYPVVIDGIFGAKTDAALRAFQKKKGAAADGICGPVTRKLLLGA